MNGLAACLEYGTSSWMCISDGHNGIWTYWAFLQIPTWPKPKTKNFLLWINSNRLCLHVGLEFWTIFSFTCSESTSFTTCKFCFTTLYLVLTHSNCFSQNFELFFQHQVFLREIKMQNSFVLSHSIYEFCWLVFSY